MKVKNIFKIVPVVVTLMLGSCDNFFNPESGDMLLEKDHFKKAPELKAAFIGVAASFQDVAEHAIIVSELRGQLMEPTVNAPIEFWEVYRYQASERGIAWLLRMYIIKLLLIVMILSVMLWRSTGKNRVLLPKD